MNSELVFKDENELASTKRVLATFKSQKLNESIDTLIGEIFKYATKIDEILSNNGYEKYYLDRVSDISTKDEIKVIDEVNLLSVMDKEKVEDLVKRINTRIALVKDSDLHLKELVKDYDLDNIDLTEEIKNANLI